MKRKIVAAMCALAVLCTSANVFPMSSVSAARKEKAVGTTYYISNRGDNQNSGTSEGEAWQTLDKLKDVKLQPGDSVLFEAGSVSKDFFICRMYTEQKKIRFGSEAMGKVINLSLMQEEKVSGIRIMVHRWITVDTVQKDMCLLPFCSTMLIM